MSVDSRQTSTQCVDVCRRRQTSTLARPLLVVRVCSCCIIKCNLTPENNRWHRQINQPNKYSLCKPKMDQWDWIHHSITSSSEWILFFVSILRCIVLVCSSIVVLCASSSDNTRRRKKMSSNIDLYPCDTHSHVLENNQERNSDNNMALKFLRECQVLS